VSSGFTVVKQSFRQGIMNMAGIDLMRANEGSLNILNLKKGITDYGRSQDV
jgi:hypothetical protein